MSARPSFGGDADSESEGDFNPGQEVGSDNENENDNDDSEIKQQPEPSSSRPQLSERRRTSNDTAALRKAGVDGDERLQSGRRNGDDAESDGGDAEQQDEDDGDGDEDDEGEGEGDRGRDGDGDEVGADDDDDEDDDDDVVQAHRRKRHKKSRRNQFIDVEAEVDEDEDDADDDEEEVETGFVADDEPPEEEIAGDPKDDTRHRELDMIRQEQENLSAEQLAAQLQDRYSGYGRNRAAAVGSKMVPQTMLMPSVDDPTIWGVRVKPGKEREVVFAVMRRVEQQAGSHHPILITAAFERGGTMAGYVYVEARKQVDVTTAMDGIPSAYPRTNMVLVPIGEMPDLLRTTKSKTIEPGMYVRVKRGKYQGDLAQVNEVESNGLEVEIKLVPREDYGASEDTNAPVQSHMVAGKRKRPNAFGKSSLANRPPQRLFSEVEAKKKHGRFLQQVDTYKSKHFTYQGNQYIGGFLLKSFKIQLLQTDSVNPTLEEVTKFTAGAEDGTENLDLSALAATLKTQTASDSYLPGDMVEIYQGEQRGVVGRATAVHSDIVTLKVTEGAMLGQTLDAPIKSLHKRFKDGDHVKVIGGSKYQDEVGLVVRTQDGRVTLLSDANNQEITVFSKDLRAATDSGISSTGNKYDLYDLVQLDPATVACVVKVDRESLKVLDQTDAVRSLLPSSISNKLERRRFAVATDKDGTEIRNDDTVKESGGDQRQGRVIHIHRSYIFIQNRQQTENSGIFAARSSTVVTVAAKGGRLNNAGPDLNKMNPTIHRNGGPGAAPGAVTAMPPPKSMGRDRLVGKSCKIRKGPHKGLLGIVKDTTDTTARVELHTKNKVVTVPKDIIGILDPVTGQHLDMAKFGGPRSAAPFNGPRSGFAGNATPARVPDMWDGARTPAMMNGSKTPGWAAQNATGRTPGWKQTAVAAAAPAPAPMSGSRTPGGWGDGSRTSYNQDGSRTTYGGATSYGSGTWNANAPYHSSSSSAPSAAPAFASGSRTPTAWDAGSRTPAAAASYGYDAPTPGFSAPTPNFSAPTPNFSAPTPNFSAPTPGFSASTPGAGEYRDHPTPRGANPYGSTPAANAATPGAYGSARTPGAIGGDGDADGEEEGYE